MMNDSRYKVLLVHDDAGDAALVREMLNQPNDGFELIPIRGYEEGLSRFARESFDILLLDLDHANGQGEDLLLTVRERMPSAATVVLTGLHNRALGAKAREVGNWDFLVKDRTDGDLLQQALRTAIERGRTGKALQESEARYRRLLESVTDYVYTVRIENNRAVSSSHGPGCIAVTGYTSAEYAADPQLWYRMIHEEDRSSVLEMTEQVLSGDTPQPLEHRIIHKDGSIRWIKNTTVPRYDEQGRLLVYDGLVADITERKRAELRLRGANEALRQSEDKLTQEFGKLSRAKYEWEVTFDAISSPLFIHDREFRIIRANRAYQEAAGIPFQEFIGKPYFTVFPKSEGPFTSCEQAMMSDGDRKRHFDEEVFVPALEKMFRSRSFKALDAGGSYLYSVHILEDITEMKRIENNVRQEMELTANLLMIAETTAYTMDIDKLMEHVARCGSKVMGCEACVTYLWDREKQVFQPAQHHGLHHEVVPLFKTEPIDGGLEFARLAMKERTPVIVGKRTGEKSSSYFAAPFAQGPDKFIATARARWMNDDTGWLVVIPLMGKDGLLGLIIGIYFGQKTFFDRDRKIVAGLSREVSLALEEAHLYRMILERSLELDQKIETLKVIHEIDRSILSSLEPHEILETTIRNISRIVPCDTAMILLADEEQKCFTRAACTGSACSDPEDLLLAFDDTSASEVIKSVRPQYVGNLGALGDMLPKERALLDQGFVAHIRVPLIVKGEPVGVLCVGSKRPAAFTPEHLSTLEKLAAQIGVALENTRLITDLKELLIGTVKSLSNAIDAKSSWTAGHSERVTRFALLMGKAMQLSGRELKDLELAGLLHDVGKIATCDAILNKPGTLTRGEYGDVKKHPQRGAELLQPIKQLKNIIPVIRHHHERYDGTGYPDGLSAENIPLWARIISVADAYDSMTDDRPYRKQFDQETALEELAHCSGSQFDPEVVLMFVGLMGRQNEQILSGAPQYRQQHYTGNYPVTLEEGSARIDA